MLFLSSSSTLVAKSHRSLLHNSLLPSPSFSLSRPRFSVTKTIPSAFRLHLGTAAALRPIHCSSNMVKAIRIHEHGGPEGSQKKERSRNGGRWCGNCCSPGVTGIVVGDLVACAGNPMGAYAEEQILPAVKFKSTLIVEPGHTVLVHAAARGVGSLLWQWANALGATVIGTVSTKEKAAQAKEDGCHHALLYEEDFVSRVNEITSGKGVEVVYDSVGKDTFEGSLACLKVRGYLVSFGQSSGAPEPLPISAQRGMNCCILLLRFSQMLRRVSYVNHTYPSSQAAQAHSDLEDRKTSGSVVLIS
ncbi:hypothetical protein SASPL_123395 [Salvia splendens]|uniref:Enoyl reductase (ER) domain-containing protein n=1 Tax=Salvia splendens TaxID=180675 RepID=A0A8X8XNZ7_SALSN|nr:hypothetical protein SASPL_123395 [Salvia splendens]